MATATDRQDEQELKAFLESYAQGVFPVDRPPERPRKLVVNTARLNSSSLSSSSSTTATSATTITSTLTTPVASPTNNDGFASYVEDFWMQNRFFPQLPTERDEMRDKVIQRFELNRPHMWSCIDRCARMANAIFKSTILVTLMSADTELVIATVDHPSLQPGDPYNYAKSVCSHTILRKDNKALEILDTQNDWRFAEAGGMPRYYAGQPFSLPSGRNSPTQAAEDMIPIGVLCVVDTNEGRAQLLSDKERALFSDIGQMISEQVEILWQTKERQREESRRLFTSRLLAQSIKGPQAMGNLRTVDARNDAAKEIREILGRDTGECDFVCVLDFSPSIVVDLITSAFHTEPHHRAGSSTITRKKVEMFASDMSARARETEYDMAKALTDDQAVATIVSWLRSYLASEEGGQLAFHDMQGPLIELLPKGTQSHVAIPLFNGSTPTLLTIAATCTRHATFEPDEIAFISNSAVILLSAIIQESLVEADAAKSAFVSMISHELRTPLHGMLSQLELIRGIASPEHLMHIGDLLETAEVSGRMLRDVLSDVLKFGKMEIAAAVDNDTEAIAPGTSSLPSSPREELRPERPEFITPSSRPSLSAEDVASPTDQVLTSVNLATLARDVLHVSYGRRRQWDTLMASGPITPGSQVDVSVAVEDLSDSASSYTTAPASPTSGSTSSRSSSQSEGEYGDWWASVDAGGLRRVLMNLASNALKYTPRGKITLALEQLPLPSSALGSSSSLSEDVTHMRRIVAGGGKKRLVQFTMTDTGIGMSKEYQQRMFKPFSQAHKLNPGSGLGLSISDQIVKRMGGAIAVSSEPGVGTVVKVTILAEFLQSSNEKLSSITLTSPNTSSPAPPPMSLTLPALPDRAAKRFATETISLV